MRISLNWSNTILMVLLMPSVAFAGEISLCPDVPGQRLSGLDVYYGEPDERELRNLMTPQGSDTPATMPERWNVSGTQAPGSPQYYVKCYYMKVDSPSWKDLSNVNQADIATVKTLPIPRDMNSCTAEFDTKAGGNPEFPPFKQDGVKCSSELLN